MSSAPDGRGALLRFGAFELDGETLELRRKGALVKLQQQPAKVLALLLSRPGDLVTREEIRSAVWGDDTYVNFDQGLNFCIKEIRAALGDHADAPRYVETLPRRGYRFVALVERDLPEPVEPLPQAAAAPEPSATPARRRRGWTLLALGGVAAAFLFGAFLTTERPLQRRMLVVLPFENLSPDSGPDRLAEGLTEELTAEIGRIQPERLGVIARTAAAQYVGKRKGVDQIARELAVDYVVEGSVRRSGERVRITVSLIKADDRAQLFSESYESASRDLFALQSDVARQIARRIQQALAPAATAVARGDKRLTGSLGREAIEARARRRA